MSLICTLTHAVGAFVVAYRHALLNEYLTQLLPLVVAYVSLVALLQQAYRRLFKEDPLLHYQSLIRRHLSNDVPTTTHDVDPLPSFEYSSIEPSSHRPFKTKRHVVMGLKRIAKTESIAIDWDYLERINLRKRLISDHPDITVGTSKAANPAIWELYEDIILSYLPRRYPTMFCISNGIFHNLITNSHYSISAARRDPTMMLKQLGENVEEDFYFMCPNSNGEFELQGFISAFPQGLLSKAKVGMTVREIHQPVPGYERRLGNGVDKCFARMAPGNYVGRLNWSIQVNGNELYLPFTGNTNPDGKDVANARRDIDMENCYVRVEHHTLNTLPRTGAIIFAVRTYLTPLRQIRVEGSGPELADAIESMPASLGVYKNRPVWGAKVCSWLREGVVTGG